MSPTPRSSSDCSGKPLPTSCQLPALDDPSSPWQTDYEVTPGRFITVRRRSGDIVVFPQIGVVNSPYLHRAYAGQVRAAILYDPTDFGHLDWLYEDRAGFAARHRRMGGPEMRPVFLSARIPDLNGDPRFFETADVGK